MKSWLRQAAAVVFGAIVFVVVLPAMAKDGLIEILGTIQAMSASGLVGDWTFAGRAVRTDGATVVKQELGRIGVGATVEVEGTDAGAGGVQATTIELKQGAPGRSWWRPIRGRRTMGRLQTGLLPAGAGAFAAVPTPLPRTTRCGSSQRPAAVFGEFVGLADARTFAAWLAPLRACEWVVYAKRPFAGPAAVLAYLSRYTHRVAISNQQLLALDERGVTFRWKDYRAKGRTRYKTMTLSANEFIRRFLLHVLPGGFHRIRHYGLLANAARREHLAHARELLHVAPAATESHPPGAPVATVQPTFVCPHCGATMIIVEIFARGETIRAPPTSRAAA